MKNNRLMLLLFILVMSNLCVAQPSGQTGPDQKLLSSPSPSSLSNLTNPNLFDGSTTINIPIYKFVGASGNYGISFNYNTKGIKVDQVASSIGLNWNLQAGGSIFRVVKDLPDELNVVGPDTTDLPDNTYLPSPYNKFRGKFVTYSESAAEQSDSKVYRDGETDEFSVSVGPLSFSFHMAPNGTFFTIPENHAKIELFLDGNLVTTLPTNINVGGTESAGVLTFKITDVEGNQFYFTRGDYERRKLLDEFTNEGLLAYYYITTKWDIVREIIDLLF